MLIEFVEIQNFRKLKSIRIDFAPETTLFVGANNSGKTSAMEALGCFLVHHRFTTNDFTLSNWTRINKIGADWEAQENRQGSPSPSLTEWETVLPCLDLWLHVEADEIHYVKDVLPTLEWEVGRLGVRLRLEPKKVDELYKDYLSAIGRVNDAKTVARQQTAPACRHSCCGPERFKTSWIGTWETTLQSALTLWTRTS